MFDRALKKQIVELKESLSDCVGSNRGLRRLFYAVWMDKSLAEDKLEAVIHERDELAQWKKSAIPLLPSQEIGELLGLTAGDDISPAIVPGIKRLLDNVGSLLKQRAELRTKVDAAANILSR